MKVIGDNAPKKAFSMNKQPKSPGKVLVRFYENVRKGEDGHGYEYDEYHLELDDYPGLEGDILGNYISFFQEAKRLEMEKNEIPMMKEDVESLNRQIADIQVAMVEMYER